MKIANLSDDAIKVLDFLLDDSYGFWEIVEIINGFESVAFNNIGYARKIIFELIEERLIDVYIENSSESVFIKQENAEATIILKAPENWIAPKSAHCDSHYSVFANRQGNAFIETHIAAANKPNFAEK